MLSPQDYGGKAPHEFLGSYRLEPDMSWTPAPKIEERDERRRLDPKLLGLTNMVRGTQNHPLELTFA